MSNFNLFSSKAIELLRFIWRHRKIYEDVDLSGKEDLVSDSLILPVPPLSYYTDSILHYAVFVVVYIL